MFPIMPTNTKGFNSHGTKVGISALFHENSHKDLWHIICTMFASLCIQKSIRNYQVCNDLFKKVTGNMNLELLIIY